MIPVNRHIRINHPIKLALAEIIHKACEKLHLDTALSETYEALGQPPQARMGHFSFPCFHIAKQLKQSPGQIAMQLQSQIEPAYHCDRVEVAGPYLNFRLSADFLGKAVAEKIASGDFFKIQLVDHSPKTMIEFSQPNTHKELHVGHMRNLCLGDALVRIHQYCGFDIISATFPGDVGTHVATCLWYLKYYAVEPSPKMNKGSWLGSLYSKGYLKLLSERGTPKEEENNKKLSEILTQIENREGPFFELWKETRAWSIALMKEVYQWAEVGFDYWYWESDVDLPSVEYVKKRLGNGIFVESEGTIGVDLSSSPKPQPVKSRDSY